MTNDLIIVKQLPVIEEQLIQVKANIEQRVSAVLSLACTEDTYKEVKKERAALNKEYKTLEDKRLEVRRAILAPYEQFEALYKDCAGNIYAEADRQLKARISEVEDGLKKQKFDDVNAYFEEYRISRNIEDGLVTFSDSAIKVGISDSRKNLREQAKAYLDRIADELALIEVQENKDEVLVEYRCSLNVAQAITIVAERYKAIEEQRQRREAASAASAAREAARDRVEAIVIQEQEDPVLLPPVMEDASDEKSFATSFRVTGTLSQLKALKQFLIDGGYEYEQL